MIVINSLELEYTKGSSNKFYNFRVIHENNELRIETEYGAIGASPRKGNAFIATSNVNKDIKEGTIEPKIVKMVGAAQKAINVKRKKGYVHVNTGNIDSIEIIRMIYKISGINKPSDATVSATAPVVDENAMIVEVVNVQGGLIEVAEVLADFSYKSLGRALNPNKLVIGFGDMVRISPNSAGQNEILGMAAR